MRPKIQRLLVVLSVPECRVQPVCRQRLNTCSAIAIQCSTTYIGSRQKCLRMPAGNAMGTGAGAAGVHATRPTHGAFSGRRCACEVGTSVGLGHGLGCAYTGQCPCADVATRGGGLAGGVVDVMDPEFPKGSPWPSGPGLAIVLVMIMSCGTERSPAPRSAPRPTPTAPSGVGVQISQGPRRGRAWAQTQSPGGPAARRLARARATCRTSYSTPAPWPVC